MDQKLTRTIVMKTFFTDATGTESNGRTGGKLTSREKMEMKMAFYGFEQNEA